MSESKLTIKFLDKYKSFEKGEIFDNLVGNLIILSGINAVGKSQLLRSMSEEWKETKQTPYGIKTMVRTKINIIQNGENINCKQIKLFSFERAFEYKNDFLNASNQNILTNREQIWNFYQTQILNKRYSLNTNSNGEYAVQHQNNNFEEDLVFNYDEIKNFIDFLFKNFSNDDILNLTKEKIFAKLPPDFQWSSSQADKKLQNKIGKIFLDYVNKREHFKSKCVWHKDASLNDKKFDDIAWLKNAPWTKMNELFKFLKLNYHFGDDYSRDEAGLSLEQKVVLLDNDSGDERHLKDLSDGEKTLLDLALSSFELEEKNIKLVLFDEYDAFLNPSIINAFFGVLDLLFKKYQKIIVTHHLTTIFQSPPSAKFYELIINSKKKHEIIPVLKEQYSDMKWFIDSLSQPDRSTFLKSPLIIISEGSNHQYIKHILSNVYKDPRAKDFWYWNGACKNDMVKNIDNFRSFNKNILLVWDCDAINDCLKYQNDLKADTPKSNIFTLCFNKNINNNVVTTGIENMFDEDITNKYMNNGFISKSVMLKEILKINDKKIFYNFKPLIEKIDSILKK